jgi:glutathione peroxidase
MISKLRLLSLCCGCFLIGCTTQQETSPVNTLYDIEVETITGQPVSLETYKGEILLIVNTASKCGFTGQYDGLQALYDKYKNQGLVVLGFPSNDFLHQEPGTNEEIQSFCKLNYGVTFPMFAKISVKGAKQHPLYQYLTSKETNPQFSGKISWNFNKFLIGGEGQVLARFGSRTKPRDPDLISQLETALLP